MKSSCLKKRGRKRRGEEREPVSRGNGAVGSNSDLADIHLQNMSSSLGNLGVDTLANFSSAMRN